MQVQCGEGQEQNVALLQTTRGIPRVLQQLSVFLEVVTGNVGQVCFHFLWFSISIWRLIFQTFLQGSVPTPARVRRARAPDPIGEVRKRLAARSD